MALPGQQEKEGKVRVKGGEQDFQFALMTTVRALQADLGKYPSS